MRAKGPPPSHPRRWLSAAAALLVASVGVAAEASSQSERGRPAAARATAFARQDSRGTQGRVSARGNQSRSSGGSSARASTRGGRGRASAGAVVSHVNLFDGLVRASSVRVAASAGAGGRRSGRVAGLRIAGRKRGTVTRRRVFDLDGHGKLVVLEAGSKGIVGMRARLTRSYRGSRRGSVVTVAFASASASDAVRPPKPKPDRPKPDRGGGRPKPKAPPRRKAPPTPESKLRERSTRGGFAFPVLMGRHHYSDDWGAPRQNTGAHEGNDVFAPAGTPVLAVTDGTLRRVGTARVPGNRLYLYSATGDYYFYGHLSSFEADARSGRRVKAGQVLGYVGSTGDAEPTPPHVHFEIHPGGGGPVNPYPFLRAWEKKRDVPTAAWLEQYGGARPGTLVVIRDYLAD
ncbi:MAG TPA: M23 family metallopeptidase [Thermoleophilaceae bacterium]|jgi:murein DD-endopeptidase MepM/ murein hydrolase activator NlpD